MSGHGSTLRHFLSAIRPAPHYSRFTCSAPRREHFREVQVTAEPYEVIAPRKIVLPSTESRIVAEVIVAGERLGKVAICARIDSRVRHNRTIRGATWRAHRARRRRDKPTLVGPAWWQCNGGADRTGRTNRNSHLRLQRWQRHLCSCWRPQAILQRESFLQNLLALPAHLGNDFWPRPRAPLPLLHRFRQRDQHRFHCLFAQTYSVQGGRSADPSETLAALVAAALPAERSTELRTPAFASRAAPSPARTPIRTRAARE